MYSLSEDDGVKVVDRNIENYSIEIMTNQNTFFVVLTCYSILVDGHLLDNITVTINRKQLKPALFINIH